MARRKSKAKREGEFIESLVKLSSFGVFFITFLITGSMNVALTLGVIGLVSSVAFLIYRRFNYDNKIKSAKMTDIDKMSGVQFEYFLNLLFKQLGYKVQETKTVGDYGADLVITKDNKRTVVQAKRYNSRVGLKAVQEAVSAIAYYKAHEGWVITNNEFTQAAIDLAKANNIRLIERDELMQLILQMNKVKPNTLVHVTKTTELKELCKKCGSELVLRKGSRGDFYGCSQFPKCRFTQNAS